MTWKAILVRSSATLRALLRRHAADLLVTLLALLLVAVEVWCVATKP